MPRARSRGARARRFDVRRDTLDFRDRMFVPTLVEVPLRVPLADYRRWDVPVLDQGREGACTGYGLATVVHYLLRRRRVDSDTTRVSPRMLYEMARRYDEWPGERYEGSSPRGAMKGWHRHGVCAERLWPARRARGITLDDTRARDARRRPLGAYFRVNHRDLVAMHCALAEVGVLYASAVVHEGWDAVGADGSIPLTPGFRDLGLHAFAIVAFDERGFWIQNSWGRRWGADGFARLAYDDWLARGQDVWVARLGAPVELSEAAPAAARLVAAAHASQGYAYSDLRPHIVSLGNDGALRASGTFGTDREAVAATVRDDVPRLTAGWTTRRVLLYAHGGLVSEESAVQRVAEYRQPLLDAQVYPISLIWKSDAWTTFGNILADALRRRTTEGAVDAAKDFLLDRLDDALEPIVRVLGGKSLWDEMKENARLATLSGEGGARILARELADLSRRGPEIELHLAGHSAGAILLAELARHLAEDRPRGAGLRVASCTLWAPACTIALFERTFLPAVTRGAIRRFAIFTLTDEAERDDNVARIYNKSLLYLVSHALEERLREPGFPGGPDRTPGVPLLGLARDVGPWNRGRRVFGSKRAAWVLAPNDRPAGEPDASRAARHGDFDDDAATVRATLARILGAGAGEGEVIFERTAAGRRDRRGELAAAASRR